MPLGKIQFTPVNKSVDPVSLLDSVEVYENAFLDSEGRICKRPGSTSLLNLGTGGKVDGIYYWEAVNKIIAVSTGRVFHSNIDGSDLTEITGAVNMFTDNKVWFVEVKDGFDDVLFMANGGDLCAINQSLVCSKVVSTGSETLPTNVISVAYMDTYVIVVGGDSSRFYFSNPKLPYRFDIGDNYDTESVPGLLLSVIALGGKLYMIKRQGVEIWYNTGTPGAPFLRRYSNLVLQTGVYSQNSIAVKGDSVVFIDVERKIVQVNEGGYVVLSEPYSLELSEFSTIEESNAFNINFGGKEYYVINFLQESRTLVFDYKNKVWYEWSYWKNDEARNYLGNCSCFVTTNNTTLIGSFFDSSIHRLDLTSNTDSGVEIVTRIKFSDFTFGNTTTLKRSTGLKLRLKRGVGRDDDVTAVPYFRIRKASDGKDINDSNFLTINLGAQGDTKPEVYVWKGSNGQYYTRKYEIIHADPSPFILVSIEELLQRITPDA